MGLLGEEKVAALLASVGAQLNRGPNQFRLTGTLSGTVRIPDLIAGRTIYEVKNVASVSFTPQIRDMAEWAARNGYGFVVYVRQGAEGILNLRLHGITVEEFPFP